MKISIVALAASLALGGSAFAAERAPQEAPDPGIFAPFEAPGCMTMKVFLAAGAKFMPLKDGTFRFLEGAFIAILPVSKELPPGDKAVLAIGPNGEVMALIVDGEQTCARFILPGFMIDMVAAIESGDRAAPDKSGRGL